MSDYLVTLIRIMAINHILCIGLFSPNVTNITYTIRIWFLNFMHKLAAKSQAI